jgi:hypothetical protein
MIVSHSSSNGDNPPLHALDQCVLKEAGQSQSRLRFALAYYNFCRIHKSLRVTPAMEAGITAHVWTIAELLAAE